MFNFNLKKAAIFQAIKWKRCSVFRLAKFLKRLFFVLFIITQILFLYGFIPAKFTQETSKKLLGASLIFLVFALGFWLKEKFFDSKLKKPKLKITIDEVIAKPEEFNLAEFLSFEVAKAVWRSIKFANSKKIPEINSSILFYFILKDYNPRVAQYINFVFSRALLSFKEIKKLLEDHFKARYLREDIPEVRRDVIPEKVYAKDFQDTILESLKIVQKKGHQRIEIGDIITALAKHDLIFKKILIDCKLKTEDIENLTWWLESLKEKIEKRKRFWEYENLAKRGTLAKEWTAGYTITLDQYSIDWTEAVKKSLPEIIGHQKELEAVERILARREINNVLLIGEPGTGRKSIIYALAKKSLLGRSLPEVNYKRVVELDLPALLSGLPNIEEVEAALDKIFQETITAGNIILVIDEFHNFVGGVIRPGVIDISGILSSYLHLPQFQIVAITTFAGLHKNIEQNPSILALFERVEVSEISLRETVMILENLALLLERKYKKIISYPAIREVVSLTDRYFPALPFPEKAMNLLDEVVIYVASSTRDSIVLPKHAVRIVTEKTQIPVGEIELKEREILLNLEDLIHQRIINQQEAVKEVSSALRRARAEITVRKGPMGCFLFLGPTGVGKTETSKALAEIYFGSEERMIRLDMSEFQAISDIPRLIGSPGQEGLLTTQVRENPFSLILLDEIEKAHPNILNLFLQVFDEGHLTDGLGRKIEFKDSIIIATSNAGYQIILEALKKEVEWSGVKSKLLDFLFNEGTFRPEFINRFDGVTIFKPLTKENLLEIAELLLQKLKKNLREKEIEFVITQPLKEKIVELGYDPKFGAREMRRVIQDKVENVLAKALLSGELKRGQKIEIESEEFKLIIE